MNSAALVFPAVSLPDCHSVSLRSACSGPKQFAGGGSSSQIVHRISLQSSPRRVSSPLYVSSFFSGSLATYRADFSTCGRVAKVWGGIRSRLSSSSGSRQSNAGPEILPALNPSESQSAVAVTLDQSLEAPSPHAEGNDMDAEPLPPMEVTAGAQEGTKLEGNGVENYIRTMEEIAAAVAQQGGKVEVPGEDKSLPTMEDIVATAAQQGIKLQVKSFGPTFEIAVTSLDESKVFGKANGWIKVWTKGKILHLESVKLERGLSKQVGNIFGAGFFVGASTLRYGLDHGCQTAELLAIYDDEATHGKLVKYYSRLGFKKLYDVDEEDWKYFPDRVVWGGMGTRMDADCEELLRNWSIILKPKAKSRSRTKGASSTAQIVQ